VFDFSPFALRSGRYVISFNEVITWLSGNLVYALGIVVVVVTLSGVPVLCLGRLPLILGMLPLVLVVLLAVLATSVPCGPSHSPVLWSVAREKLSANATILKVLVVEICVPPSFVTVVRWLNSTSTSRDNPRIQSRNKLFIG